MEPRTQDRQRATQAPGEIGADKTSAAPRSLLEQHRRKLVQATPPGQKLVSGPRGFVEDGVDAGLLQFFRSGLLASGRFRACPLPKNTALTCFLKAAGSLISARGMLPPLNRPM